MTEITPERPPEAASSLRLWPRLAFIVVFFAGIEGLVFHTPLYSSIVEPDSSTGFMESLLRNEVKRQTQDRNQVLAVGHSRMALLPRLANEMQPPTGYTFASIGLGGTSARTWYYALRAIDPHANRYAAIIIPSDDYNEPGAYDRGTEREVDLHYLIARLGLRDLFEFPWTFQRRELQWATLRGIVFKGFVYKRDFIEFLDHPYLRITKVSLYSRGSASWTYTYGGVDKDLTGIDIDWPHRTIHFPDRVPPDERVVMTRELFSPPPNDNRETEYLRYWYGRILDHYRNSETKIFFVRVPRAPISPPDPAPKLDSAVRQAASRPGVVVLDEHLLDPLERPELFWDGIHLNREGSDRFSKIVASEVRRVLGPPKS